MAARRAKVSASATAPAMVISQPMTAMEPMAARLAGSMKTPDPIMLPATIRVAGTRPILAASASLEAAGAVSVEDMLASPSAHDAVDEIAPVLHLHAVRVVGKAGEAQVIGFQRLEIAEHGAICRAGILAGIKSGMPGG